MSVTHYICKYTPVELLRAFGASTAAAVFVIRAIALLTHAGLIAKCLYVRACRHAVRIAAGQHFHDKYFEIQNNSIACGNLLCYS